MARTIIRLQDRNKEIYDIHSDKAMHNNVPCIVYCNTGDQIVGNNIFNDEKTAELFIVLYHKDSEAILNYFKTFNGTIMYYHLLEYIEDVRGD